MQAQPSVGASSEAAGALRNGVQAFVFGAFRLDVAREHLIGEHGAQVLRRKAFVTLRVLLDAAPALVTLDQLLDRVWGRHATSASTVPKVIAELRHALGDEARAARYIETRHRRGYRIVADVTRELVQDPRDTAARHAHRDTHPLLRVLDEAHAGCAQTSLRERLERLHRAALESALPFLALQAQLALQAHRDARALAGASAQLRSSQQETDAARASGEISACNADHSA